MNKTMNAIKYLKYILAALLPLVLASCNQEEPYAPGEKDDPNCMYFYFPANDNAIHHELELDAPTSLKFLACRKVEDGDASIPFRVIANDEVFVVDEIFFNDGQTETEFSISFDDAEPGKKYTCTVVVDDPAYVSAYALEDAELTFSVMRVSWKHLGTGLWRDDMLSTGFDCANPYLETECQVYEREDLPGYYKIEDVYNPEYVAELMDGHFNNLADWESAIEDVPIYLDASDLTKPWFDVNYIGLTMGSYGEAFIYSDVPELYGANSSILYLNYEDGVFTAPTGGIIFELVAYGALRANQSNMFRFVLPGYKPYDYSIALSNKESENGILPVTFTLGTNVKEVKYAVYEGRVNEVEVVGKVEDIKNGKVAVKKITETGTYDLTFDKSGFYTIVACTYDENGEYQKSASLRFGYDTADDPRDIKLTAGLIVSDKNAPSGLTSENSLEYYVYGEDIEVAKVALFKKAHYDNFRENMQNEIEYYIAPLNTRQLDSLNKTGYTGVIGGLAAGTEYTLVVYADNGYHKEFISTTAKTEGEFDMFNEEFNVYDLPASAQPESHDAYFQEWQLWSLDLLKEGAVGREFRSNVTVYDKADEYYDEEGKPVDDPDLAANKVDFVGLRGMFPKTVEKYGVSNVIDFEYYEGFIYSLMTQMKPAAYQGSLLYPTNFYYFVSAQGLGATLGNGAMIGGFCDEGVVAFVSNPQFGANIIAMGLCYFKKADYSDEGALFTEEVHGYPMLVSPDSPALNRGSEAIASLKAPAACERVSMALQAERRNYVETDRGYVMSTIDMIRKAPYNYMEKAVASDVHGHVSVECSVKQSSDMPSASGELKKGNWMETLKK